MAKSEENKAIGPLRARIDEIDSQILELLNQRAGISLAVGRVKSGGEPVFKPFREKEVLERLCRENPGPLPEKHLRAIYREVLSSSRRLQRPERVVYLGPEGTFSYFAGIEYLGHSAELTPRDGFEDIFRAVADGEAEMGVIPLENSLQGTVGQAADLFMRYPVFIQAEIFCRISHSLLSSAKVLSEVREVHSHPKALEQCGEWLKNNLPGRPLMPAASTARAAELAAGNPGAAAIGSHRLGGMFGLNVLAEHLEDL
ncbi:MAG: prephenate dehydratase domain-containing protein, partial [Desulfovibrionaceae bacterium]|nr:prephenate dehydratase domain-containing protein [Desulfovibrionaceae bacterium]